MSVGNEKLKELVKALDEVVEIVEDVFADGKVDFADASQLPRLATPVQKIYGSIKDIKALGEEAKDLDWSEFKQLIEVLEN